MTLDQILDSDPTLFDVQSKAPGPRGILPVTPEMLLQRPSGDLFGWTQNAGMGWDPARMAGPEFLILSTHGGIRAADGTPIALGYHTGHWEVGLLMDAAAKELKSLGAVPFAAYCTDPCDGRSQGTTGMFDSLPYRNDAASVFGRLIRSLPTRRGAIGVATCDKGLPAMMMALAGAAARGLPTVLVPGGVTLLAEEGEDAGKVQSAGARFAHGQITVAEAAEVMCRACASPGGGCQFLGTAATAQVVGEALGMSLPHSALAPSGHPIWLDMARRSARAALAQTSWPAAFALTQDAIDNALVLHAAFGGSTNLILHLPAIAFSAGLSRPTVDDWTRINRQVPRLVDALPNGPQMYPTVQVFLAGGVPEVMLHLRRAGLLHTNARTVAGETLDTLLDWWEQSERRAALRRVLKERDGVDPAAVIMDPDSARRRGLTSTVTFPMGNLAPGGSVIKSTAIDPSVVGADGIFRLTGPARIFRTEPDAVAAIKSGAIHAGDVIVLMCRGPMGSGMEEIYQITSALKYLEFGKHVAVITDARFSGVSTGACIGHITPEALAGGPLGKLREGDPVEIVVDRMNLTGSVNLVVDGSGEEGTRELASRPLREDLAPDAALPEATRLWAILQDASGGTWGGCVFDVETIGARVRGTKAP